MREGAIVVVHLAQPTEKYWGRIESIAAYGVTVRGINLGSFEDWLRELASGEPPSMGLATVFFPMARVERMFLDEQVGVVESFCQRFEQRVGRPVDEALE